MLTISAGKTSSGKKAASWFAAEGFPIGRASFDGGVRPADRVFGMEPADFCRMVYRLALPPELAAMNIHRHMLRHACEFDLVGRADLQARAAFTGHKRLENTARYSKLAPEQFEGLRS